MLIWPECSAAKRPKDTERCSSGREQLNAQGTKQELHVQEAALVWMAMLTWAGTPPAAASWLESTEQKLKEVYTHS